MTPSLREATSREVETVRFTLYHQPQSWSLTAEHREYNVVVTGVRHGKNSLLVDWRVHGVEFAPHLPPVGPTERKRVWAMIKPLIEEVILAQTGKYARGLTPTLTEGLF